MSSIDDKMAPKSFNYPGYSKYCFKMFSDHSLIQHTVLVISMEIGDKNLCSLF